MSNLKLKTRRNLFLYSAGEHQSIFSGDGLDFKEIREYDSGDDIRHVNWKVTARSGQASVNIFNEEKQLNIVVVYLNSGSIYFGSSRSKQDTAIETVTTLCNTAAIQNDLFTTVIFNENEQQFFKPTKNKKVVDLIAQSAYSHEPIGHTINYDKLSYYLLNKIKKKSLVFIVGDFFEIPDFKLLGRKHEVYCAIVRDKLEENLQLTGEFNFIDTNSLSEELVYLDDTSIKKYHEKLQQHDKELFGHFKRNRIKAEKIYTDQDVVKQLYGLVKK